MSSLIFLVLYILVIYFGFSILKAGVSLKSKDLVNAGKIWIYTVAIISVYSIYNYFKIIF